MKKPFLLVFICISAIFAGCATTASTAEIKQLAITTGKNIAMQAIVHLATGGKFDQAWATTAALNSVSGVVGSLTNTATADVIESAVKDFTQDPSFLSVAQKLAQGYLTLNPQTEEQKTAAIVGLSTGVSGALPISQ